MPDNHSLIQGDTFLTHLEMSARSKFGAKRTDDARFVETFRPRPGAVMSYPIKQRIGGIDLGRFGQDLVLKRAEDLFRRDRFTLPNGIDESLGRIVASFHADYDKYTPFIGRLQFPGATMELVFHVRLTVLPEGPVDIELSADLPTWLNSFEERLRAELAEHPDEVIESFNMTARGWSYDGLDVREPGVLVTRPLAGICLDYSGCAKEDDLADLHAGGLPLGRWAFGWPGIKGGVRHGMHPLFLPRDPAGHSVAERGVLVCGAQGSGKTHLLAAWARATNASGYNVVAFDMSGDLADALRDGLRADSATYFVSTDPCDPRGDVLDLLDGLDAVTPSGAPDMRHLAEALMPREAWEAGSQPFPYPDHVRWLTALIRLTCLARDHAIADADLGLMSRLAAEEATLEQVLEETTSKIGLSEPARVALAACRSDLAVLISSAGGRGQRAPSTPYRSLTQNMVNTLRPFSATGSLHSATAQGPYESARRVFGLDVLNGAGPVVVCLTVRERDTSDAAALRALLIKRLEALLASRTRRSGARSPHLLLLLDDAHWIAGFDPRQLLRAARGTEAACIVAYQALDQIDDDDRKTQVVLANIGAHIYLGSLVGNTARLFIGILPMRRQPSFSVSRAKLNAATVQTGQEIVEYFTSAELFSLPGGERPALVCINALRRLPPFLVDLDGLGPKTKSAEKN